MKHKLYLSLLILMMVACFGVIFYLMHRAHIPIEPIGLLFGVLGGALGMLTAVLLIKLVQFLHSIVNRNKNAK